MYVNIFFRRSTTGYPHSINKFIDMLLHPPNSMYIFNGHIRQRSGKLTINVHTYLIHKIVEEYFKVFRLYRPNCGSVRIFEENKLDYLKEVL